MAPSNGLLQQLQEKASQLKQASTSGKRNLRHEIRRFQETDPTLEDLSLVVRDVRKGKVQEEACMVSRKLEDAEAELHSLSEQIDAVVMEAYVSIERRRELPGDFLSSLTVFFDLWHAAEKKREEAEGWFRSVSGVLDSAIELCGEFWKRIDQESPSNRPMRCDAAYFRTLEKGHLLLLRDMLFSMANILVLKKARELEISLDAARAVACEITKTVTTVPPELYVPSADLKRMRRVAQRAMMKRKSAKGKLVQVIKLHRAVAEAIPEEVKTQNEVHQRLRDIFTRMAKINTYGLKPREFGYSSIEREADSATTELNALVDESFTRKAFLLEFASSHLAWRGLDLDSDDIEAAISNEGVFRYLVLTAIMLRDSVYTEEYMDWASWFLPEDLLSIISPLNFLLEHSSVHGLASRSDLSLNILEKEGIDPKTTMDMSVFTDLHPLSMALLPDLFLSKALRVYPEANNQLIVHFGINLFDVIVPEQE